MGEPEFTVGEDLPPGAVGGDQAEFLVATGVGYLELEAECRPGVAAEEAFALPEQGGGGRETPYLPAESALGEQIERAAATRQFIGPGGEEQGLDQMAIRGAQEPEAQAQGVSAFTFEGGPGDVDPVEGLDPPVKAATQEG